MVIFPRSNIRGSFRDLPPKVFLIFCVVWMNLVAVLVLLILLPPSSAWKIEICSRARRSSSSSSTGVELDNNDGITFDAISLEEYNAAFNCASYCIDGDNLVELNRLTWKKRVNFETEQAWQAAVTKEVEWLHEGNGGDKVGIWEAEAPSDKYLTSSSIAALETRLQLSLDKLVVSERGDTRFFTVSGTVAEVTPLLREGFRTLTPVPKSLKISPQVLVEGMLKEQQGGQDDEEGAVYGLDVELTTRSQYRGEAEDTTTTTTRAEALSVSWRGAVATRLQHTNAVVEAQGTSRVSVEGVTRAEALAVAMELAKQSDVEFITKAGRMEMSNHESSGILQSGTPSHYPLWDIGVHGEGQVVGIRDSGFDLASCYFRDPLRPAITENRYTPKIRNFPGHRKVVAHGGLYFDDVHRNYHGTHVAGSVAGFPTGQADTTHKGVAYGAKLALYDHRTPIRDDLELFLDLAYKVGKWRSYGIEKKVDAFKNGMAVGASHSSLDLAGFSARGPTRDGRIKPEIVAPGLGITSASSGSPCGVGPSSGTSMASPLLAGTAALVRQYFTDGYYPKGVKKSGNGFTPMAALLKAVLMNSGARLTGTQATTQGNHFPGNDQGFGLAKVDNVLVTPASPDGLVTEVHGKWSPGCSTCPKLYHKATKTYSVKIAQGTNSLPLRVTLAWSDYWAQPNANKVIINDLDLTLKLNGVTTYPNALNGFDRRNTVERIIIDNPQPGATYTLTVSGFNVPRGPQPYALVITGPLYEEEKSVCTSGALRCNNGGTCVPMRGGSGRCVCPKVFSGATCSTKEPRCPTGFVGANCDIRTWCVEGVCYSTGAKSSKLSWAAAINYCEDTIGDGWTLACPRSQVQNDLALAVANRGLNSQGIRRRDRHKKWLGYGLPPTRANEEKLFCYSDTTTTMGYNNWRSGESPGDKEVFPTPQESCVEMRLHGKWAMDSCSSTRWAICSHVQDKEVRGLSVVEGEEEDINTLRMALAGGAALIVISAVATVFVRRRYGYLQHVEE